MGNHRHTRSILHGYQIILTRLLVLMGISTFTSKEFSIFCRVSKIGNAYTILYGICMYIYCFCIWVNAPVVKDEKGQCVLCRSFGLALMSWARTTRIPLTCPCQLCLTWRRLGEEVHLGHESVSFQAKALGLLRAAFEELVDYREAHRLSLWQPLAGGSQQGAEISTIKTLLP